MVKSIVGHAISDTITAQTTVRFMWLGQAVTGIAGAVLGHELGERGILAPEFSAIIGGFLGLIAAVLIVFAWNLVAAPYVVLKEAILELSLVSPKNVDEFSVLVQSLNNQKVNGFTFAEIVLRIAPTIAYEPDQGEVYGSIGELTRIEEESAEHTHLRGKQILGDLVSAGVLELRHPGNSVAFGHPYVRSVYMTEEGRQVLRRLHGEGDT